jgi:hypothetical protein
MKTSCCTTPTAHCAAHTARVPQLYKHQEMSYDPTSTNTPPAVFK